jgi:iron-only hydrogenase group A
MIKIEVNGRTVEAKKGETILSALNNCGIHVPTICSMAELSPTGACRMCVVEVEGFEKLVPACSFPVSEWMRIKTHSPRVLRARKTNVELLLSNHPDDCLYCERNGNCELQHLAEDLNVRERHMQGGRRELKTDHSGFGIVRDPEKCILCSRCVRVCEEMIGVSTLDFINRGSTLRIDTAMSNPIGFSNCIDCGQCSINCPTGALTEKTEFHQLDAVNHDPEKVTLIQYTPAVSVSLAEEFGIKNKIDVKGVLNAALRKIGFDYVFDTAFGGDVVIMEQASEIIERMKQEQNLPMITSSCPSLVKYIEQFRPELLPNLSTVKSPHQAIGRLIKTWFTKLNHIEAEKVFSVLVSTCTAAKYEAHSGEKDSKGKADIDAVLTTRELVRLIKLNGIDMHSLEPEPADGPFHATTSAGKLFAVAGGEAEATLRTIHYLLDNKELPDIRMSKFRGTRDVREVSVETSKREVRVASVSGLKKAMKLLDEITSGKKNFDLLEIMTCPEGCVGGGGQPIPLLENDLKTRIKLIYDIDKNETLNAAHKNLSVRKMYEEFARAPGTEESRLLLHRGFNERKILK